MEKIQRRGDSRASSKPIIQQEAVMSSDTLFQKFGIHSAITKNAQNMLGSMIVKLGTTVDKKQHISTLLAGKKA